MKQEKRKAQSKASIISLASKVSNIARHQRETEEMLNQKSWRKNKEATRNKSLIAQSEITYAERQEQKANQEVRNQELEVIVQQ